MNIHRGTVAAALVAALAMGGGACRKSSTSPSNLPASGDPSPAPSPAPGSPPVLSSPIVSLSTVRRFIPFGAELSPGRRNPAYEFVVNGADVDVVAATSGAVTRIELQEQGDSELHVQPAAANYLVIYDHVRDVAVTVGQSIQPGTRLGRVGVWSAGQGRVELQINRETLSVCPRDLGTTEFNAAHAAALAAANPNEQQPGWTDVCLAATVQP